MNQETLDKANKLQGDIKNIRKVLDDYSEYKWISVISPRNKELYYSGRFDDELAEWLKVKAEEYQKEFDEL